MRFCIRLILSLTSVFLMLVFGLPCSAITGNPEDSLIQAAESLEIPSEVQNEFDRIGIEPAHPESLLTLSPDTMLNEIYHVAARELSAPLRLCGVLLTLTVLSSLLGNLGDAAAGGSLRKIFDALCTLLCVGTAAEPLCDILVRTAQTLDVGHTFMTGYIPIFGAFIAAGGHVAGSASYQVFMLFLTHGIMQLIHAILFPILQMSAALGIADAVNPSLRLGGFVGSLRSVVIWVLGFVMTMFSALLSARSIVASAADSLASKSVKLLASGLIPIVGSAVSDAYGTVQGSIRLLCSGVGAVGILVLLWLILPPLLALIFYRIVFRINGIVADMAGTKPLSQLYGNVQSVLSAAFAILVCFAVILIVSTAALLLLLSN